MITCAFSQARTDDTARRHAWAAAARLGVLLTVLFGIATPVNGIINPQFTPVELVRAASQITLLELSPPDNGSMAGRVVETLKGAPADQKSIRLEWDEPGGLSREEVAAAFGGEKSATAILFAPHRATKGAIQIGTQWFAATRRGEAWQLAPNAEARFSVWAGSATMLARAVRYVLADSKARFPVRSEMAWGSDLKLGKVAGRVNGSITADFGAPLGLCVVVLSDAGDRVFSTSGREVVDVAAKARLQTASLVAASGDFDGDGRMDLASWDGKTLKLALQTAAGAFDVRPVPIGLRECLSLACIDVSAATSGLVITTGQGPALLTPDEKGGYAVRNLAEASPAELGSGLCVAADIDNDGQCDVVELFSGAMVLHAAEAPGRYKDPVRAAVRLVNQPKAAICGDYDTDGQLDLLVAGSDGLALLSRDGQNRWQVITHVTGELAYHGNANQPRIVAGWPCDINNDGRQGMALFYPNRYPMLFFNRGFACFGLARELELANSSTAAADAADPFAQATETKLNAAEALQHGQTTGAVLDLNGDGVQDLFSVDLQGETWALLGQRQGAGPTLTIALAPKAHGPVTVTVTAKDRCVGMHVVRPGVPVSVGCAQPGPLKLLWPGRDGTTQRRDGDVSKSTRIELIP